MFLISVKFVQTSVDYWFRNQIDNSLKTALEIGKINYKYIQDNLEHLLDRFTNKNFNKHSEKELIKITSAFAKENNIGILILKEDEKVVGYISEDWKKIWDELNSKIEWDSIEKKGEFWVNIYSFEESDYVIGVSPLSKKRYTRLRFYNRGDKT